MMQAFSFGGYTAYIAGAYGVFLFVFILGALSVGWQSRRVRSQLRKRYNALNCRSLTEVSVDAAVKPQQSGGAEAK
jgi:hypothetical protein